MDRITVACVQQRLRLPFTLDDYRDNLRRFARAAQNKQARLIIFPELAGLLVGVPYLADFRSGLLLRADQGRRRRAGIWQRTTGAVAQSMAGLFHADLRTSLSGLLELHGDDLWASYIDVYGGLAREYGMTVVAPSAYLPDPLDGVPRNLAAVFGPDGYLLGTQAKLMLHAEDQDLVEPGTALNVIPTEAGRIGLMLGNDILYPEIGRLLAYQEAEMLIGQASCTTPALYNKLRTGMLARMQDNQLFSAISFLVGHNDFGRSSREPFAGKSAILAPQDLTPRFSGVLVEMGSQRSEGVLTAEWDFAALRKLWEESDTPVRRQLPVQQANEILARLYSRQHLLSDGGEEDALIRQDEEARAKADAAGKAADAVIALDDLPVFASITRRWPLDGSSADDELPIAQLQSRDTVAGSPIRTEDETDEMDALPGRFDE